MEDKICLIYNFAQHYRTGIFRKMDNRLNVDFFFGDSLNDIKKMDYHELSNHHEIKNILIWKPIYYQYGAVSLIFRKYDKYIILGEYHCISTWLILIFSRLLRKKVYLWSHGYYGNEGLIKSTFKKLFFSLSDGVFLYGNYARRLMIERGFEPEKLKVIYNSLDYEYQIKLRRRLKETNIYHEHFANNHPVLIFIGRLTFEKELHLLVEAVQLLEAQGLNLNVVFVGSGAAQESLIQRIDVDQLATYWFYGPCYDEGEISELIYNSDICISPGNVGLTAMHALMYGTPVITHSNFEHQNPEVEAITSGKTGAFFKKGDGSSLASVISDWLNNNESREEIRQECYRIMDERYNPEYQIEVISKTII